MVHPRGMSEGAQAGFTSSSLFRSKSWEEEERAESDLKARHGLLEEVKRREVAETYDTSTRNSRCKVPWTLHFLC